MVHLAAFDRGNGDCRRAVDGSRQGAKCRRGAIYLLERGRVDDTPVLFAHGTAAWSGLSLPTLETVGAGRCRAIDHDLPPFGYSAYAIDRDYSRQQQADRIQALVNALDMRQILVAHSFVAGLVAEAVMQEPDEFAELVLVAGAIGLNTHLDPKELPGIIRNDRIREFAVAATATNPYLTGKFLRDLFHVEKAADTSFLQKWSSHPFIRGRIQTVPSPNNAETRKERTKLPFEISVGMSASRLQRPIVRLVQRSQAFLRQPRKQDWRQIHRDLIATHEDQQRRGNRFGQYNQKQCYVAVPGVNCRRQRHFQVDQV